MLLLAASVLAGCGTADQAEPSRPPEPTPLATRAAAAPAVPEKADWAGLQQQWWQWAMSEPEATNPVADPDGTFCDRNQPDDVWFLAGTFGGHADRRCTVPAGVPVVVPLVNTLNSEVCPDYSTAAVGEAKLDGKRIEPETVHGEPMRVSGVPGNPVTGTDERFTALGCGLWVRLPAPEPGPHTLSITGRSGGFETSATYELTVKEMGAVSS
jgi:hypothetical protein